MRSLWKRTTEFWTQDMPKDDTWDPNRHHREIRQLFRNHFNQTASAMHSPFVNTVAQTEHGRRDSSLSLMSHGKDAKNKRIRVVFGLPELSHVSSTNHDDSSCATALQDVASETTNTARQRQFRRWHG